MLELYFLLQRNLYKSSFTALGVLCDIYQQLHSLCELNTGNYFISQA